jgi:hypothetical protein
LAIFSLLKRFFDTLLTIPQVYNEVVTQGQRRPGAFELQQAAVHVAIWHRDIPA